MTNQLWITRCPVPTASSVAFDRGLLERDLGPLGVAVASLQDAPDEATRDAHFHHGLDGLVREGGNVPALWARSTGTATRLVALTWIDEYQAILTTDPALAGDPARLAGRRLGIPRYLDAVVDFQAAMALRGFDAVLGLAGAGLSDVELVDLPATRSRTGWGPGERAPRGAWELELRALRDGVADAVYVKGAPGVAAARAAGVHEVVEFGSHPDPAVRVNNGTPRTITVAAALLDEQPQVVARYLATLLDAADWAGVNGEEVARVFSSETGGDRDAVRRAYGDARLHPDLREDWLDALDLERAFLRDQGLLGPDGGFDVRAWVDPAPLAAARTLRSATHEDRIHA
ncbi:ABC transporter substrate-binding protein [Conexibacter woesei]|uniref:Nitrate/sulfonate/bicarbonate ABC transporter periplasmic ligand-binding protein n=1 Tax=Conexibacter woesei (strain DSM 14684 / CCUG 47730 / CIP 108061 / JCM 11494 / NBRC 100937 / ID131577) TaxID=469383 RepID=D3F2G7_CONWI|nr:ABC transporter substrate-binding protein [Conexibacter woesei]ADB52233.1 nitrate/sulfonate/bicarbonate ABC transporter periplasmic ligand-binding protein [Conexibacter woesei DSM 14684]